MVLIVGRGGRATNVRDIILTMTYVTIPRYLPGGSDQNQRTSDRTLGIYFLSKFGKIHLEVLEQKLILL